MSVSKKRLDIYFPLVKTILVNENTRKEITLLKHHY